MTTNKVKHIFRVTIAILMAMGISCMPVEAKKKKTVSKPAGTVEKVEQDKKNTQRQISETSGKIKANTREINRQMSRLNDLNADIDNGRRSIERLNARIDTLSALADEARDSLSMLEGELENMRQIYITALQRLQLEESKMNAWTFVLSSRSFSEAYQRIRYLRQFSRWRQQKADNIRHASERIAERRTRLSILHAESDDALRNVAETQKKLTRNQAEAEALLASLKKQDAALRQILKEQKQKAAALDKELDRLIAEQQRKAAEEQRKKQQEAERNKQKSDAKQQSTASASSGNASKPSGVSAEKTAAEATASLTGSFAENKGKLPFPVGGKYRIVRQFGRHPHPTLPNVETDNSGIDIEVPGGTPVRAVFDGKVSAIFKQDGFNSIIMVRHGNYITIYAGLDKISVRQGDNVKTGQTLGAVVTDTENDGKGVLHFEIRNERQKLNPSAWVK